MIWRGGARPEHGFVTLVVDPAWVVRSSASDGVQAGKISNVCILGDRISHTQWQNSFAIGRQLIEGNIPFWVRESNVKLKLLLQVSSPPPFDLLATPPPIRKTSLLESFRPRSKWVDLGCNHPCLRCSRFWPNCCHAPAAFLSVHCWSYFWRVSWGWRFPGLMPQEEPWKGPTSSPTCGAQTRQVWDENERKRKKDN